MQLDIYFSLFANFLDILTASGDMNNENIIIKLQCDDKIYCPLLLLKFVVFLL